MSTVESQLVRLGSAPSTAARVLLTAPFQPRAVLHRDGGIKDKKTQSQYSVYQEPCFLPLISQCGGRDPHPWDVTWKRGGCAQGIASGDVTGDWGRDWGRNWRRDWGRVHQSSCVLPEATL